ncbi:MAG: protein kinase [Thermoguttaceae bacterium]|nr:protein kinase [Thermoguttaceae bacterium]
MSNGNSNENIHDEFETVVFGSGGANPQSGSGVRMPEEVLSVGDILCDTYILRARLGRGGMGEVWKADEVYEGEILRTVVIKTLAPNVPNVQEEMARIQSMFHKIHSLQHQHICPMYAMKNDPKAGTIIVMKYIDGMMLQEYYAQYMRANNEFPVSEVVRLLLPIAQALDYSHSKQVLHRDVKPQNILVSNDESDGVQLIDFGLVMEMRSSMAGRGMAQQFDTSGTLPYMSPEQWSGEFQDARSDQFSLAVVVYELLSGHLPFTGTNIQLLGFQILNKSPDPIIGVPDHVNFALQRALSKNRKLRFESCEDFIRALEDQKLTQDVMSQAEIKAAEEQKNKTERPVNWIPWILGGSLALFLVLILGIILLLTREQKQIAQLNQQVNQQTQPSVPLQPIDEDSLYSRRRNEMGAYPYRQDNLRTTPEPPAAGKEKTPEAPKTAENPEPKTETVEEALTKPESGEASTPEAESGEKPGTQTGQEAKPEEKPDVKPEEPQAAESGTKEEPADSASQEEAAPEPEEPEDPIAKLTPEEILKGAHEALKNKNLEEAFQFFQHLTPEDLSDEDLDVYGDLCSDLGRDVTATKIRAIQMSRNPSRETVQECIRDAIEAQNFKSAIEWCDYVLKEDPEDAETLRQKLTSLAILAGIVHDAGPARHAMEIANQLVEKQPDDPNSYADRGFVYMKNPTVFEKAYDFSKKDFEKALSLDPNNISALLYQGIQLRDVFSKKQAAYQNFQKVLELDADNPDAQLQLGLLLKEEKPTVAAEYLTAFLKLQPERWDVYEQRGNIYFGLGENEKALADYNLCLKFTPQNFPVLYQRAQTETRLKFWRDAKADLDFLIENDSEPKNQVNYYKTLAQVYEGGGNKRKAKEAREKSEKIRIRIF